MLFKQQEGAIGQLENERRENERMAQLLSERIVSPRM